jgi:hypothetical protein
LILFYFSLHYFSFFCTYVGLGFPLIRLCEFGLSLQEQMFGKELRGRVIGPMGTNKEKPIALARCGKEKPNAQ